MPDMSAIENTPEISFIDNKTVEDVRSEMVADYEEYMTNAQGVAVSLDRASVHRMILYAAAAQIYQAMQYIDRQGKQSLLKYSYSDFLDNLAIFKGVTRNQATAATCTLRFTLSAERETATAIPQGTRVASSGAVYFATDEYAEIPAGILLSLVFLFLMGKVRGSVYLTNVGETCNKGCQSAVSAIMNTAAAVGFGSVVKITPGFAFLSELVLGIGGSPLIAESIAINVLAGATGSASGGLLIALDALADNFIQMSQTSGIPLAVFHRVGSIACGGLNTMPHDGAVVTYLSYCKISHKRGYFDMFIVAGAIPILANIVAIILGTIGIV